MKLRGDIRAGMRAECKTCVCSMWRDPTMHLARHNHAGKIPTMNMQSGGKRLKVVLYNPHAVFFTMPLALLAIGSELDPSTSTKS